MAIITNREHLSTELGMHTCAHMHSELYYTVKGESEGDFVERDFLFALREAARLCEHGVHWQTVWYDMTSYRNHNSNTSASTCNDTHTHNACISACNDSCMSKCSHPYEHTHMHALRTWAFMLEFILKPQHSA